ncbi:MAG: 4Fe-4S binding protein [Thermoplasmata archaeon]
MVVRKIIRIDETKCTGCGQCVTACAEGALEIVDGKAKVVKESFCDGLGACIGECPEGALTIEERDAEEFDEEEAKKHMARHTRKNHLEKCGCPSSAPMNIEKPSRVHTGGEEQTARLGHWPIQLALVPENAPFLKGRDLVVIADCAAVAYGNIQNRFIDGNAIVICCPKLDDTGPYERKLENIIKNSGIRSISVVHMEVPCCFGLHRLVTKALEKISGKIPYRQYVIGIKGDIKN